MEFKHLNVLLQENFKKISKDSSYLFEVELDKDELWNLYLDSFPPGTNEILRERREYDCNCCRQFIRNIGNAIVIKNNEIFTIWDFESGSAKYQPVLNALSTFVKSKAVKDIWISKFNRIGVPKNFENSDGEIHEWNHFFLDLPNTFINKSYKSDAEVKGILRDIRNVFKRSLDELSEESVLTVLELISQNSLYKGEEWKSVLTHFLKYKKEYDKLDPSLKDNYAWEQSVIAGGAIGKIRNHSMGTLLVNLSEGMDLDLAVKKYESIVAGPNYKRPKPIHTKRQLDDARKFLEEEGYLESGSLERRYAVLDDITVNNILFSNKDSAKRISGAANIFDEMSKDIAINPKKFSKIEEISIDDFVKNILPTAREIELLLENKHGMVSLVAPKNKGSKSMFKWPNGFSWAYSGNMTDSFMKENVKSAGGNVDGVLRFSIQWNDLPNEYDGNDLDAHCFEPDGYEIYFGNKTILSPTGGVLDVDIQRPKAGIPAVENITWASTKKMKKGTYRFLVNNYANRGGRSGVRVEIEFNGQIHSFNYNKEIRNKQKIEIAEVYFDGETFTIKEKLPSSVSSKEVWNLKTNQFIPVSVVMYSPNYWDEQKSIGHKHYFFMLKDCINPENPNGFYNEFLKEEFRQHRHVMEALGGKLAVESAEDQLSGVGFSSTKRNEAIVKVKGQFERVLKIKF